MNVENLAEPAAGAGAPAGSAERTGPERRRTGRKRAVVALGALMGAGALAATAAFTDFALLDLNGSGGFGGASNAYNLQVSTQQVDRVGDLRDADWVEANPDAEPFAIPGADALVPGGAPVVAKIPVRNDSSKLRSTLALTLENTTPAGTAADDARNAAYADLMRVEVAVVDDASDLSGASWRSIPMGAFATASGRSEQLVLPELDADAGRIAVVRIGLASGADDDAANGGRVEMQARFDGTAVG